MNKDFKAKALTDLQSGKITFDECRRLLTDNGSSYLQINFWDEITPGVLKNNETGEVININELLKSNSTTLNIIQINFNKDGSVVGPPPVSSEKDIDIS